MYIKKIVYSLSIVCLIFGLNACKSKGKKQELPEAEVQFIVADNARYRHNWIGSYSGTLPCADCPGIAVQITLKQDNTFEVSWKYQGKDDEAYNHSGTFQWDDEGNIITFDGLDNDKYPVMYKVGEEHLLQLDTEGNVIAGEHAQEYIISKFSNH